MENSTETTTTNNTTTTPSKSKKKPLLIVAILLIVMLASCATCGIAFYVIMQAVGEGARDINSTVVVPLCEDSKNGNVTSYFSPEFKLENDAEAVAEKAFGSYENCDELKIDSFSAIFTKQHSVMIQADLSGTTADYSFRNDDGVSVKLYLKQDGEAWVITNVSFIELY
ncbi:MAG: hypothetical protein QY318_04880 [Candidatus Dojkabacteria bacterium]|nr:MAG: hypothetical protein QY318_04880 [Candidatus Dojkabacteria bacterium]